MGAFGSLLSLPQKIALGGVGAALVAALSFNVVQLVENRHLARDNTVLAAQINDPQTGYVVKLAQARTNVATCATAVERQNVIVREQSAKGATAVAAVQKRYDTEHAARVRAESAAAAFLARKPRGATLADRVKDVDAQILEDLK